MSFKNTNLNYLINRKGVTLCNIKEITYPSRIIMARILTGIQSTGTPHLGNILGAIMHAIEMANKVDNESF